MTTDGATFAGADLGDLVARVENIADVLSSHEDFAERERQLAPRVIEALDEAGLFQMFNPPRFGGSGTTVSEASKCIQAIAQHSGSAAWVTMIVNGSNLFASRFTDAAQDDVFGANPRARMASIFKAASSDVEATSNGITVSGRWPYASGIMHDDWAALLCDDQVALIPTAQLSIEKTWDTVGMRGTGSHTVVARDVQVPTHRLVRMDLLSSTDPAVTDSLSPTLRVYTPGSAVVLVASVVVGLGQAALRYVRGAAPSRGIAMTNFARQVDSGAFVAKLGESALKLESARLQLAEAARLLDSAALENRRFSQTDAAAVRGGAGSANATAVSAIDDLMWAGGASAFATSNPLQRVWRDANTAARHAGVIVTITNEIFGGALVGTEPIVPVI